MSYYWKLYCLMLLRWLLCLCRKDYKMTSKPILEEPDQVWQDEEDKSERLSNQKVPEKKGNKWSRMLWQKEPFLQEAFFALLLWTGGFSYLKQLDLKQWSQKSWKFVLCSVMHYGDRKAKVRKGQTHKDSGHSANNRQPEGPPQCWAPSNLWMFARSWREELQ